MEDIEGANGKIYKPITAKNYLCVPYVIRMVLCSEKYDISIEEIANYFGVVLPPGIYYNQINNYCYSDDSHIQGITIKQNSINDFFHFHKLPLVEEYIRINHINKDFFTDCINDLLLQGNHIICGYEYHSLQKEKDEYAGHVSLIINVNTHYDSVVLLDPGPKDAGCKTVDAYDLYNAISLAKDGLWTIKREVSVT